MTEITVEPSILTRDFNAPMKLVYEAWTQEQHLCRWQVPNPDIQCEYKFADIKSGGSALHKMLMPNGNEMWLLTQYHELTPHHTIIFTQYSSNEQGDILPPPMPNWPKEIRATIKFSEANGVTNMQFIWQPINPTPEEAEAWEASRSQHGKGWGGSFEVLAAYLAVS
ncbi:MAG: SRPBCC family protein [Cellvibrionaceae bacterium]